MRKRVLIILAKGFEEIEAVTQIDLLRRAELDVTTAGLGATNIIGGTGISITTDKLFANDDTSYDAFVLPGGSIGVKHLIASTKVLALLKEVYDEHKLIAAICAAPLILDAANILSNHDYTSYPGIEKEIHSGTFVNKNVCCDGTLITSKGVGTSIPFALAIIEYLLDTTCADDIAMKTLYKSHTYM